MKIKQIMDNLKEYLKELASEHAHTDSNDFDIYGMCGGNYDDAYYSGTDDGQILLARQLLKEYFNDHEQFDEKPELAPF